MAKMLNLENKLLLNEFYYVVNYKLNERIVNIKYLGGGSNVKAYSIV